MAAKKKIEDVKEDALEQEEIQEVRDSEPAVDLPGDAVSNTTEGTAEAPLELDQSDDTVDPEDTETKSTTKAGKRSAKAIREASAEEDRLAAKDERAEEDDEPKAKRSVPNPVNAHGKKFRAAAEKVEAGKAYGLTEALALAKETATTKFDSSVQIHINLGVDPRQADQMVRASVNLPHGTGKSIRIAVFADGKAGEDAKAAGADIVGTDFLITSIEAGKLDFDILIATPDKMATLGKVAKVLGPRGLMPNPKSGTVTPDPSKAVAEAKGGKVEFRIDKQAIVHQVIGRASFTPEQLLENAQAMVGAILKAKPSAAKGTYVKAMALSTAMGPGIKIDGAATVADISGAKR